MILPYIDRAAPWGLCLLGAGRRAGVDLLGSSCRLLPKFVCTSV